MSGLRKCHPHVFQGSREDAEQHWAEHDMVLGVCPTPAVGIKTDYLSHGVRDEDTPTHDDITTWMEFLRKHSVGYGSRAIVHCEAGQNRSAIVAALAVVVFFTKGDRIKAWDTVVARLHEEFLQCDPPHNWWPYDHWDKAIRDWLNKESNYGYAT